MATKNDPEKPGTKAYTERMLKDADFREEFRERAIELGDITACCKEFGLYQPRLYTLSVEDKDLRDWFTVTREAVHWYLVDSVPKIVGRADIDHNEKRLRIWAAFMQADRLVPSLAKNLRGGPNQNVNITAQTLQVVTEEQRTRLIGLLEAKQALEAPKKDAIDAEFKKITENTNGSNHQQDAIRGESPRDQVGRAANGTAGTA